MSTCFYSNVIWLQSGSKMSTLGHLHYLTASNLEKVNKMENALQILELQLHRTELKIELH